MKTRVDPTPRLLSLADRQAGVLTAGQAAAAGLGRHSVGRLVADGSWQRLATGLYLAGRGRPTWKALAWGGVLLGGPGALLGDQAAAYVHGLVDTSPKEIAVWIPRPTTREDRPPWIFRRERGCIRRRGGVVPPSISAEDTVLDLIASADVQQVIALVTRAVQHRLSSPPFLLLRMAERGRVPHRRLLTELLADVADGAETPLELAYLRDVEQAHRLPPGARQQRDRPSGHHRDVWYEEWRTVVELDGRLGHEGLGRFRDMALDNSGVVRGHATLRFGWHDVRGRPCEVARQVGLVLRRRGWTGEPTTCRRCRASGRAHAG